MRAIARFVQRLVSPRAYWEHRAQKLPRSAWFVGRTDMMSFDAFDGGYEHYAYGPHDARKRFRGNHVSALRRAVIYAENANTEVSGDSPPN